MSVVIAFGGTRNKNYFFGSNFPICKITLVGFISKVSLPGGGLYSFVDVVYSKEIVIHKSNGHGKMLQRSRKGRRRQYAICCQTCQYTAHMTQTIS